MFIAKRPPGRLVRWSGTTDIEVVDTGSLGVRADDDWGAVPCADSADDWRANRAVSGGLASSASRIRRLLNNSWLANPIQSVLESLASAGLVAGCMNHFADARPGTRN